MSIDMKARQLLDRRLDALQILVDALDQITKARVELDARERKAWAAVSQAGWSDKDLAGLGLTVKRGRAPRRQRARAEAPNSTQTDSPTEAGSDEFAA